MYRTMIDMQQIVSWPWLLALLRNDPVGPVELVTEVMSAAMKCPGVSGTRTWLYEVGQFDSDLC